LCFFEVDGLNSSTEKKIFSTLAYSMQASHFQRNCGLKYSLQEADQLKIKDKNKKFCQICRINVLIRTIYIAGYGDKT
jgi:hypothetical protein